MRLKKFVIAVLLMLSIIAWPKVAAADGCTSAGCTTSGYFPIFQFPFFYSCFWQYTSWFDGSYSYYDTCGGAASGLYVYWH